MIKTIVAGAALADALERQRRWFDRHVVDALHRQRDEQRAAERLEIRRKYNERRRRDVTAAGKYGTAKYRMAKAGRRPVEAH